MTQYYYNFAVRFFVLNFALTLCTQPSIQMQPSLQALLADMQHYKLFAQVYTYLHGGNLYEHSIWTYNAMVELLNSDTVYVQNLNLTSREKEVVSIAALLHDIGKAGRKELFDKTHPKLDYTILHKDDVWSISYRVDHEEHTMVGFLYAIGKKIYYGINKNTDLYPINVTTIFDDLKLTQQEQALIAVLIGIHYEFGNLKHKKITYEQFLEKLSNLTIAAHYNDGVCDEKLVRLAILIQVADVKGLMNVKVQKTPLFPNGISAEPTYTKTRFKDPFSALGYECDCCDGVPLAATTMYELLKCFHANKNPTYSNACGNS